MISWQLLRRDEATIVQNTRAQYTETQGGCSEWADLESAQFERPLLLRGTHEEDQRRGSGRLAERYGLAVSTPQERFI